MRVAWIIWCLAWAGFWLTLDTLAMTGGYTGSAAGRLLVAALFVASVACIWLPFAGGAKMPTEKNGARKR